MLFYGLYVLIKFKMHGITEHPCNSDILSMTVIQGLVITDTSATAMAL